MRIAKIAVEAATYAIDKPYSYLVPAEMALGVGCRVLAPFGRGNRTSEGIVLSLEDGVPAGPLKALRLNLDGDPLISQREIKLALWMRQRYFCTFYDAIRTILPAAVWYHYRELWRIVPGAPWQELSARETALCRMLAEGPQETSTLRDAFGEGAAAVLRGLEKQGVVSRETVSRRNVQDKTVQLVQLALSPEDAAAWAKSKKKSAPRMYDAVQFLLQQSEAAVHELCYFTGVSRQTVTALEKRGVVTLRTQEAYRITDKITAVKAESITLNDEQQQAYADILGRVEAAKGGVTLLQGVTGSGKTLVYIRLAQELLSQGKSVMILVPEIALTPQMMARFTAYFGDRVALLHSALRATERYDQWKRIRKGEATVVLGTRSAVFAPLEHLGLIVLDEEQESSYESERAPCYHARDIAKYRCMTEGCHLVLGSATPTVETAWHAKNGDYHLALLRRRYNRQSLPGVIIADMRQELRQGNLTAISQPLYHELQANLTRGEQSILFLNRRGSSRQLLCPNCSFVPQCPRCSVYLTYHSANGRLMCHYCGYSEKAPEACPECGTHLRHIGFGTQRVEEELRELFPDTPILRMDADTISAGHEAILKEFDEKKVPILIGTQMVAKGLDFENVTLVGVLAADLSLYVDHYRASERTFSLLTQVVGRAGRGEKTGRAVIQTYTPGNDVIQAAAVQDYERFYEGEIRLRKLRRDPPFADQFMVTVTGPEESAVRRAIQEISDSLASASRQPPYDALGLMILGPAPAPVVKVNDRYRYRVTVIGRNDKTLRGLLAAFMKAFSKRGENRSMQIYTDCNLMD